MENEDGVGDLEGLAAWSESPENYARRKFAKRRLHGSRLAKACATMEVMRIWRRLKLHSVVAA